MSNISVPYWPSLYNPGVEIVNIEGKEPIQPDGKYLFQARDVFSFTLYWTLCLYTPAFILCGCYAFWNLNFPPVRNDIYYNDRDAPTNTNESYQLSSLTTSRCRNIRRSRPKGNERRSRLTFAFLVLFTFLSISVAGAVIGSAVLGFTVFGLFKSGGFAMSTWIPFLLAVMQVLAGLLSIWPSIIDVI